MADALIWKKDLVLPLEQDLPVIPARDRAHDAVEVQHLGGIKRRAHSLSCQRLLRRCSLAPDQRRSSVSPPRGENMQRPSSTAPAGVPPALAAPLSAEQSEYLPARAVNNDEKDDIRVAMR